MGKGYSNSDREAVSFKAVNSLQEIKLKRMEATHKGLIILKEEEDGSVIFSIPARFNSRGEFEGPKAGKLNPRGRHEWLYI